MLAGWQAGLLSMFISQSVDTKLERSVILFTMLKS
jgi:hypothetical protein